MSHAHIPTSLTLSAPPELIEADLAAQLADASAQLAELRAARPAAPDLAWSRHHALVQNTYTRILDRLIRIRKALSASTSRPETAGPPQAIPTPEPAPMGPRVAHQPRIPMASLPGRNPASSFLPVAASPAPAPRNRQERRRLEALQKRSQARFPSRNAPLTSPARAIRPNHGFATNPNSSGLVKSHTMEEMPRDRAGQSPEPEGKSR